MYSSSTPLGSGHGGSCAGRTSEIPTDRKKWRNSISLVVGSVRSTASKRRTEEGIKVRSTGSIKIGIRRWRELSMSSNILMLVSNATHLLNTELLERTRTRIAL